MEAFRSSDAYDDEAHQLYDEGRFDDALTLLREGLERYPEAVELHVGHGYARLARQEFAWAGKAFQIALILDPDHEDALTGHGEVLLALGQVEQAFATFQRVIELGFYNDLELMLQIGRALYRLGFLAEAQRFFDLARTHHPGSPDPAASLGYTAHRLGLDSDAIYWLRRALEIDPQFSEPRIYLANLLYDRGAPQAALHHFLRTLPEDHLDEIGIWRVVELLREVQHLPDDDPIVLLWLDRLDDLESELFDPDDLLLDELVDSDSETADRDPRQLELFGTLMRDHSTIQRHPGGDERSHLIETLGGHTLRGSWDELVSQLQVLDGAWADNTTNEFMQSIARRSLIQTGIQISRSSPESFLRGAAESGWIRVLR